MTRSILIHGALLTVALGLSYSTWSREEVQETEEGAVIVDAEPGDLSEVRFESEDQRLVMTFKSDDHGEFIWVENVDMKKKKAPPPPAPPSEEEKEASEGETEGETSEQATAEQEAVMPVEAEPVIAEELKVFKAGKAGRDLAGKLAPFVAKRQLDGVTDAQLEALGLVTPSGTLTLTRTGKSPVVVDVGGEAYGTRDRYVRDKESGRIYIVAADVLRPIEHAKTRLPDRDILGAKQPELTHLAVETEDGSAQFEQQNRDDRKAAFWAAPGAEGANAVAEGWLDKFFRLRSRGYVQADEIPTGLTSQFTVQTTDEAGVSSRLEVLTGTNEKGEEGWYAKSQHTRELVKLDKMLASETREDLETVLGE